MNNPDVRNSQRLHIQFRLGPLDHVYSYDRIEPEENQTC